MVLKVFLCNIILNCNLLFRNFVKNIRSPFHPKEIMFRQKSLCFASFFKYFADHAPSQSIHLFLPRLHHFSFNSQLQYYYYYYYYYYFGIMVVIVLTKCPNHYDHLSSIISVMYRTHIISLILRFLIFSFLYFLATIRHAIVPIFLASNSCRV